MDKLPVELVYDILDKASNPNSCNLNKMTYNYCVKKSLYENIILKTLSKSRNSWDVLKNNKYFLHVVKKPKYKDFMINLILKSAEPVDFFKDKYFLKIFTEEKPFLYIMQYGPISIFKYYINKGINIYIQNSEYYSYTDINKKFLQEDPCNFLGLASYFKRIDILEFLLKKGFNIHANEEAALSSSVSNKKIFEFLLSKNADISFNNSELLVEAVKYTEIEKIKMLIDNGIKINNLVLEIALRQNRKHVIDIIIKAMTKQNGKSYIEHIKN